MTKTGVPHAGSCGDGHPHLAFCVLNILGGWSPAVLLECHARHTPHTRAGRQPSQPLWINKHRLLWGRQQPHLHAPKARSRPLPHLNLGQEEPAGVLWGSCSSSGAMSQSCPNPGCWCCHHLCSLASAWRCVIHHGLLETQQPKNEHPAGRVPDLPYPVPKTGPGKQQGPNGHLLNELNDAGRNK